MKIANNYKEAFELLRETAVPAVPIGIDIGKQFGTRVIMIINPLNAQKLLSALQEKDLPCPQMIWYNNRILIGAEPE